MIRPSDVGLNVFVNELTKGLLRAEELKDKGEEQSCKAIEEEWEGASALDTLFLNVDCFVR